MSSALSKSGLAKTSGLWAVFACGGALFSDGYQNGVVGLVNLLLRKLHPVEMKANSHGVYYSSFGFLGIVLGQLIFGFIVDKFGRKDAMFWATVLVAFWTAMAAMAYGANGSIDGMLVALIVYRVFSGIGIGAEYPAGSVACAEHTEDADIAKGRQGAWFALATNSAIDWGFVISAVVPMVFLAIFPDKLEVAWRGSLAVGVLPPLIVMYFRSHVDESKLYVKDGMKNAPIPYGLIAKRYWRPLLGLSFAWFCYDWIAYPFGIYSSTIVDGIIGSSAGLTAVLGWNVVINLFYIPGTMIGAMYIDKVGPKRMMIIMLVAQGIVGFGMSGRYVQLQQSIGGFAVVYGIFLSLGEAGPGNCLGLLAAKSFPTAARGQMYAFAAVVGKIGALVGTYTFPQIIASFPEGPAQDSGPFWIGSGVAIASAIVVYFSLKEIRVDHMELEDAEFRAYLEENGYDTSRMGLRTLCDEEKPVTTLEKFESTDSPSSPVDEKVVV